MAGHGSQAEIWERNILGTEKDKCRDVEGTSLTHRGTAKGQGAWCVLEHSREGQGGGQGIRDIFSRDGGKTGYLGSQRLHMQDRDTRRREC